MNHKYTFEEVQQYLDKQPLLYFKTTLSTDDIDKMLLEYFKINSETDTYQNFDEVQCYSGKRRSIGDIYRTCKHYKKDLTLKEVYESLVKSCNELSLRSVICNDIKKRTYCRANAGYIGSGLGGTIDEYGFSYIPTDKFSNYTNDYATQIDIYENKDVVNIAEVEKVAQIPEIQETTSTYTYIYNNTHFNV